MKKAADAANRKMCFVGMSLNTYLEAAANEGMAPFDPKDLIPATDLDSYDPNEVLVVTTGSQVWHLPLFFSFLFFSFLFFSFRSFSFLFFPFLSFPFLSFLFFSPPTSYQGHWCSVMLQARVL